VLSAEPAQPAETEEPSAVPYPPPLQGWWTVAVLTLLYAVSLMDRQVFTLLIVPISRSLRINDFQISILSGFAFAAFYAVFGLAFGWAADRWRRRGLIQGGLVLWSFATMACGAVRSFGQLALARFAVGGGEAALNPAAYSMIADTIPRKRLSLAIGVFGTGVMIGGLLSHLGGAMLMTFLPPQGLALPLLGPTEPWRLVFMLIGLPGLLLAFIVWTIPEPVRRQRLGLDRASFADALKFMAARWRFYGLFFAGAGLISATNYSFGVWLPAFFMRTYGLSVAQAGFLLGPMVVVPQIVGLLVTGVVADRFFARGRTDIHLRVLMVLGVGKAALVTAAMAAPIPLWAAAVLLSSATLFSAVVGVAPAALQFVTPNEYRGQVSSAYLFVYTLFGLGVGPMVAGALTTFVFKDPMRIGWAVAATFLIMTPLALVCLAGAMKPARRVAAEAQAWGRT
jgi:MFS family permease